MVPRVRCRVDLRSASSPAYSSCRNRYRSKHSAKKPRSTRALRTRSSDPVPPALRDDALECDEFCQVVGFVLTTMTTVFARFA
jgi:hypothetical protein